jgi:hypothetical protein
MHVFGRRGIAWPAAKLLAAVGVVLAVLLAMIVSATPARAAGNWSTYFVSGVFRPGTAFVAVTPCDANNAPATCPAPGFPANYLGTLNMFTGHIAKVSLGGASLHPQGMIFVSF